MTLESLKDAYIHLNDAERAAFASFVMSDYRPDEYQFTPEEIAELERRISEVESGTAKTYSMEEVHAIISQEHGFDIPLPR